MRHDAGHTEPIHWARWAHPLRGRPEVCVPLPAVHRDAVGRSHTVPGKPAARARENSAGVADAE